MHVPKSWLGANPANRLLAPVILLTLMTVGVVIYLVPGSSGSTAPLAGRGLTRPDAATSSYPGSPATFPTMPSATPTTTTPPAPAKPSLLRRAVPTKAQIIRAALPAATARSWTPPAPTRTVVVTKDETATPKPLPPTTTTVSVTPKAKHCWDFTWQQDAQAAYVANLSDPMGLDGQPGPYNGDGMACTELPVDPNRARSTPVAAYTPPAAAVGTKTDLALPRTNYFGITEDGLPGATRQLDAVDKQLGAAPNSIGFFDYWTNSYPQAKVRSAWQRGALPVMTWMSMPEDNNAPNGFSFTHILAGNWDDYLYRYAGDIVRTGLPVVIRFDHEMNGAWYPWSAGHTDWNNSPDQYIAVWRHVWDIFQKVGANDDVIWLWSPARVDNISAAKYASTIAADYPGDAYVDWVGATVYWRNGDQPTDYATSFGATISQIRAVTQKPMFFAEIGAIQNYQDVDQTAEKIAWMKATIQGFLADPSVVGFTWFNNIATTADDPTHAHDWRFNASAATTAAFKTLVDDPRFGTGVMPDGKGQNS